MLIKLDFSSKTGILVVKFAFATANLKIETLRMRRRFARVIDKTLLVSILYILIRRSLFFLFANIFSSQFEPLFRLPRDTLFVEYF